MEDRKRNGPCGCGSGKKFKNCCVHKQPESQKILLGIGAVLVVGLVWGLASAVRTVSDTTPRTPPPGKVWNEEHQHFHDAPLRLETPASGGGPGKVWSEEHGHFHDAPAPAAPAGELPTPSDLVSDPPESSSN